MHEDHDAAGRVHPKETEGAVVCVLLLLVTAISIGILSFLRLGSNAVITIHIGKTTISKTTWTCAQTRNTGKGVPPPSPPQRHGGIRLRRFWIAGFRETQAPPPKQQQCCCDGDGLNERKEAAIAGRHRQWQQHHHPQTLDGQQYQRWWQRAESRSLRNNTDDEQQRESLLWVPQSQQDACCDCGRWRKWRKSIADDGRKRIGKL